MPRALFALLTLAVGASAATLAGCTPHIGDHCVLNTDCSLQGTKVCDDSQTNGYCTSFNCAPNTCPDNAACVLLYANVPGCPYDGYQSPSRTARSMCLAQCQKTSDCRVSEGYQCAAPSASPIHGLVIDDYQTPLVCVPVPDFDGGATVPPDAATEAAAPVCLANGPIVPTIDASLAPLTGGE